MAEVGRPTIMTDEKVKEIEGYFANGATDLEACFLAGISKQTLYNYQDNNSEFVDRKEALKDMIKYQARLRIKDAILKEERPETAKWYLERKDKEFKQKTDITSDDKELKVTGINYIIPNGDNPETNSETAPSISGS